MISGRGPQNTKDGHVALILPVVVPGEHVQVLLPFGQYKPLVLVVAPSEPYAQVARAMTFVDRAYRIMRRPRTSNVPAGVIRESDETGTDRYWGARPDTDFGVCQWRFPQEDSRPRVAIALLHRKTIAKAVQLQTTTDLLMKCMDSAFLHVEASAILRDLTALEEMRTMKQKGEFGA